MEILCLLQETLFFISHRQLSRRKKSFIYVFSVFCRITPKVRISKEYLVIAKSIAQCRARVGVVEEAAEKEPREAKFEGVMWHGGYDQSITSSAARAPHTAHSTNITGTITFRPLHLRRGGEDREKARRRGERRGGRVMHAYKFACRL